MNNIEARIRAFLHGYSENTISSYQNDVRSFYGYVDKDIEDVSPLDITQYFIFLENSGFRNSTINRKLYSLNRIFQVCKAADIIKKNPVEIARLNSRMKKPVSKRVSLDLSKDEVLKVIHYANPKTSVIIETLANSGMRISELISIKTDEIEGHNFIFSKVLIRGKGQKERSIFLSNRLLEKISSIYNMDSELLFHSSSALPLNRSNLYTQIKKSFNRYTGKNISPHSLRHFFSTYKISTERIDPKAISSYLGHSSVNITLEMYTHSVLRPEDSEIIASSSVDYFNNRGLSSARSSG